MKEKNGEYLNIGEATEDCRDVNELTYALKGGDGRWTRGFCYQQRHQHRQRHQQHNYPPTL